MDFHVKTDDFFGALKAIAQVIGDNRDYVSELDAATGDGDHWVNINMGFEKLLASENDLRGLPLTDFLKKAAMLMMSAIGGSSGVLYGSAFISAAKALSGAEELNAANFGTFLTAMCQGIMERGKTEPGYKTMVDAIHPAALAYREGRGRGEDAAEVLRQAARAAEEGARATADMQAVRGRAYYQANKGLGHIDPGAVTMSYIIRGLADYIIANCAA